MAYNATLNITYLEKNFYDMFIVYWHDIYFK